MASLSKSSRQKTKSSRGVLGISIGTTNCYIAVWGDQVLNEVPSTDCVGKYTAYLGKLLFNQNYDITPQKSGIRESPRDPWATMDHFGGRFGPRFSQVMQDKIVETSPDIATRTIPWMASVAPNGEISPKERVTQVLVEAKKEAEAFLGRTPECVVIAVPPQFEDEGRTLLRNQSVSIGLPVERVANKNVMACLGYGLGHRVSSQSGGTQILTFDFGSTCLTVSSLLLDDGFFERRDTWSCKELGGDAMDQRLVSYLDELQHSPASPYSGSSPLPHSSNSRHHHFLKLAREIKHRLSSESEITFELDDRGPRRAITREEFEKLFDDFFKESVAFLEKFLTAQSLSKSEIHHCILMGGGCCVPKVRDVLQQYFASEGQRTAVQFMIDPRHVAAHGAAAQAEIIAPCERKYFESVCIGPIDVVPFTLRVEVAGGKSVIICPRDIIMPTTKTTTFTTTNDGQTDAVMRIYGGEHQLVTSDYHLGTLRLSGISPGPWRNTEIKITVDVVYGHQGGTLLNVSAQELGGRRRESSISIDSATIPQECMEHLVNVSHQIGSEETSAQELEYRLLST